jgi:hypothetical protein
VTRAPRTSGLLSRLRRDARACGVGGIAALLAVLALPGLHTWNHRIDHTHGPAGEIVPLAHMVGAHAEAHAHGRAHVHESDAATIEVAPSTPVTPSVPDAGATPTQIGVDQPVHAAGGAAHFAVGLRDTPVFAVFAPIPLIVVTAPAPAAAPCLFATIDGKTARGPPAARFV